MHGENFYNLKHFTVAMPVILLYGWGRDALAIFSWLKTKFTGVYLCTLGRGEFAHLVLITKIKATKITCFVPKEQILKHSFSMHWKWFHALNCSEEVIKMSVSFLKRSERTSRQQATEAAAVLPWFPSFNFQRAAGVMSTLQRPQGITSSLSLQLLLWGGN